MANEHRKRCSDGSTSLIIRKIRIKGTMRYHLAPIRKAIIFFFFFPSFNSNWSWLLRGEKTTQKESMKTSRSDGAKEASNIY